ncbi:MAG: cell envelope integrity protein CreD [Chitinophagaceae bacterium]|nr:MAG: cell envelope integrity protein CreD [Chitinophagaceae bacterium]
MEKKLNSFWQQNRLVIKGAFIGILTLLLLIPMAFISFLVNDREQRHNAAYKEVSSKWAAPQTLTGPVLVIPYQVSSKDEKGNLQTEIKQAYFLPDSLQINGAIQPEKRYRGIYEVILYRSSLTMQGKFNELNSGDLKIAHNDWLPGQAYLLLGLDDMRGIENQVALKWNDSLKYFNPGIPENQVMKVGLYVPLPLDISTFDKGSFGFNIHLKLKGSGELNIVPAGKITLVSIHSPWNTPSFIGSFLPDEHTVNSKGFNAHWTIFNLNRNFPQHWSEGNYDLDQSKFGVSLMLPVDMYQKTMRCIKYAILIIALTFTVFFLIETSQKNAVHPFQYILIGLALCIFYTLLLSLSEYLNFTSAYAISAIATIGLISVYASWVFKGKKIPILVCVTMLMLYSFIFVLAQLQDLSLMIGSIGLFMVLALLMYFSRKMNRENYLATKP